MFVHINFTDATYIRFGVGTMVKRSRRNGIIAKWTFLASLKNNPNCLEYLAEIHSVDLFSV